MESGKIYTDRAAGFNQKQTAINVKPLLVTSNYFSIFLLIFLGVSFLFAQGYESIPKNTSYTLRSALIKVNRKYPDAEPADIDHNNVTVYKNIEYADYNGRKLSLDLFSPKNSREDKLPLVILIHGGGWASGDRSMLIPLATRIAENGFITAAIEYRLSPESLYPAALNDILTSIKWLKLNSKEYKIDSSKVALLGTSAGGHLAALTATIDESNYETPNEFDNTTASIDAVIDIDGVLDLTHPAESRKDTVESNPSVLKRWLGYTYSENHELWMKASPLNNIKKTTPPLLFVNSSVPRFHAGRDSMITKMNEFNIYSEAHTIDDSPHSFWLFKPWFEQTYTHVTKFLNKIFAN